MPDILKNLPTIKISSKHKNYILIKNLKFSLNRSSRKDFILKIISGEPPTYFLLSHNSGEFAPDRDRVNRLLIMNRVNMKRKFKRVK